MAKKQKQNGLVAELQKIMDETAAKAASAGKEKVPRAKVRLVSTDPEFEGLWVRAFVDVILEHGVPCDPKGQPMVPGAAPRFGLSAEEREARKAEKEAEKARIAAMSDEEKLAYAKERREARKAKRLARKKAERDQLIAQLKAEIKAGKLSLDD